MGYTHYWEQTKVATKAQIEKIQKEVKVLVTDLPKHTETAGGFHAEEPLVLGNGWGTDKPIFSENEITFNGKEELGHETFFLKYKKKNNDFCKTARKPYDFVVCLCLLSFAKNVPSFKFGSDGSFNDWQPAIDYYREKIGEINVVVSNDNQKLIIS